MKMFQCGYISLIVQDDVPVAGQVIEGIRQNCEKVVLGIPDALTFARLFGDVPYSAEGKRQELLAQTAADEVILVGDEGDYREVWEKVHFDALWYGSRFGRAFEDFSSFAEQNGIAMFSMLPERFVDAGATSALKIALENLQRHQKIVLFGTGKYFDIYMDRYGKRYPPAYAVDNAKERQGTVKAGLIIQRPEVLKIENPEDILVIVCAKEYEGILQQLQGLGRFDYRLLVFNNSIALLEEYALARAGELRYIERAHAVLAEMLKEFDRVCRKHSLHYYMICGSLIGVLRHQGFIPWDDDVDVAMPREDYERLKRIAPAEWEGTDYRLLPFEDYGNGAFLDCMPRVLYMKERLPMKVYDKVAGRASEDIMNRPFLDIYVMDNAFDNQKLHMFVMNSMKGVYNLLMGHRSQIDYEEYRIAIPDQTIRWMKLIHTVGRYLPLKFLTWWYDSLSQSANRHVCENVFMPSCAIRCIERKFKKSFFQEGLRKPFLDFEVTVPSDYDGLMEAMGYHGYMTFPRMSIRKPSHYFNSDIIIW